MSDAIPILLFCCMAALSVLSCAYPWRLETRFSQMMLHAPLLMIPCFLAYEIFIPTNIGVRFDLAIVALLLIASFFCYFIKLFALHRPGMSIHVTLNTSRSFDITSRSGRLHGARADLHTTAPRAAAEGVA